MTGHIFITGQIGNSYNEQNEVTQKGVELLDVVEQVQAAGEVEGYMFHINSPGGFVTVGDSIADFIGSLENAHTVAENMCASIATKIHLSVPLQNRTIQEGCDYIIHNPFLQNVTGDSDALKSLSDNIKETEKQLEGMYSKATGLPKETISGLMAVETALTADQCVKLKFASSITPKQQARAVALIYNEKVNKMKKPFNERLTLAMAVIAGTAEAVATTENERTAKALVIETDNGTIETEYEDLQVGDTVMIDGAPAPDGKYTAPDGMVIVVVEGMISEIKMPEVESEDNVEELKAKLAEQEAKIVALETDKGTLETEKASIETIAETAVAKLEELAKLGSTYKAPEAQNRFKAPTVAKTPREQMEARKAEYDKNKKK